MKRFLKFYYYLTAFLVMFIVGSIEVNAIGTTNCRTTMARLFNNSYDDGDITLLNNITEDDGSSCGDFSIYGYFQINFRESQERTIDLNGYTLDLNHRFDIYAKEGAILNIIDSSEEKTGKLIIPKINLLSCDSDACYNVDINISGGNYVADTLISTYDAEHIQNFTFSNATFKGANFVSGSFDNVVIKEAVLQPKENNLRFMQTEYDFSFRDVLESGYKVINDGVSVDLNTNVNNIVSQENMYIIKDNNYLSVAEFEEVQYGYNEVKINPIKITNLSDIPLTIKKIFLSNEENFTLNGSSEITLQKNEYNATEYSIKVNDGLSAGEYQTDIIAVDSNDNYYVTSTKINVLPIKVSNPIVVSNNEFVYDGNSKKLEFSGYDAAIMTITSPNAVNPGIYSITVSLNKNYCWEDGSQGDLVFNLEIKPIKIPKPITISDVLVYDGTYKKLTFSGYDESTMMAIHPDALLPGEYSTTIRLLKSYYAWEDGTKDDLIFDFDVVPAKITKPVITSSDRFIYDGNYHIIAVSGYDSSKMSRSGYQSYSYPGKYSISFKPYQGYVWEDGTSTTVILYWEIYRAVSNITINGKDIVYTDEDYTYFAKIEPENAGNKNIIWTVENKTGSATISDEGILTPLSPGLVTIRASATDGSKIYSEKNVEIREPVEIPIRKIIIKSDKLYIDNGITMYLKAFIYPYNATDKTVIWSSSDTTIATINPNTGGLSTKYKSGNVTITATSVDGSEVIGTIDLIVGKTAVNVNHTTSIGNTSWVTYKDVIWEISDETVLENTGESGYTSVSSGGVTHYKHSVKVKGLKSGTTTVKLKTISGDLLATSTIYVINPVTSISSNEKEISIELGQNKQLQISIQPTVVDEGFDIIIYSSSDNDIVSVDEDGVVTAHKIGKANIYVYSQYGNEYYIIPVNVVVFSNKLELDTYEINFDDNNRTYKIIYNVGPEEATNKNVVFETSDSSIITVDENGLITALENGTAIITVQTVDGKVKKEINVTANGLRKSIEEYSFSKPNDFYYNREEQKPKIIVKNGNVTLIENEDYVIEYKNNKNVGEATIKISGINKYKGEKILNFKILKAQIASLGNVGWGIDGTMTYYDGKEHGIEIVDLNEAIKVKYANDEGDYILDESLKYVNVGTYTIDYMIYIDDNYMPSYHSAIMEIKKSYISDNTNHSEFWFDNKKHSIDLELTANDYDVVYSVKSKDYKEIYNLHNYTDNYYSPNNINKPYLLNPGYYYINYLVSSNNHYSLEGSRKLIIYGITGYDNSVLNIRNNMLVIKNYITEYEVIRNKFNVLFQSSYTLEHYNSGKTTTNLGSGLYVRTGDYLSFIIDNKKLYEYSVAILGDVNGDGKISALDYVKIKNHIMITNLISGNEFLTSADINEDQKISALDYVKIKNYIMKGKN